MLDIGLVLFSTWLWTETELRSVNIQKSMRPTSTCSHLKQTMVNKVFIILGNKNTLFCGTRGIIPRW